MHAQKQCVAKTTTYLILKMVAVCKSLYIFWDGRVSHPIKHWNLTVQPKATELFPEQNER